jgi:hypothetical protein
MRRNGQGNCRPGTWMRFARIRLDYRADFTACQEQLAA